MIATVVALFYELMSNKFNTFKNKLIKISVVKVLLQNN
jgi:archaellum component FlaC